MPGVILKEQTFDRHDKAADLAHRYLPPVDQRVRQIPNPDKRVWYKCVPDSGSTPAAPAFGVVEIVDVVLEGDQPVIHYQRPSEDNLTKTAVLWGQAIPSGATAGAEGLCTLEPTFAAYNTASAPAFDEDWGTEASSYLIKKGNTGFKILGAINSGAVFVRRPETDTSTATRFYNDSGETIPAYGCMAVTGVHTDPAYVKVGKPSTTFRRQYLPNGAAAVPAGETGIVPTARYHKWLYNSGTPAVDEGYGPTPGQWYLTKAYPDVTLVAGIEDASAKILKGTLHTIDVVIGKLAGTLTVGSSATVNVWSSEATPTVITSLTLSAHDWLMRSGSITTGTKVIVTWIGGKAWISEASCGP
jgi:hypothetical protein